MLAPWTQDGQHGVTIFFVLSGFLITSTLFKHSANLPTFYIRRFFRLMPVAWSYLLFVWLIGLAYPVRAMSTPEIASCLFFFRNYIHHENLLRATHFWSLSIEEQFYLAWPTIFLCLGKRRAAVLAALAAGSCALFRLANWAAYDRQWFNFHTEARADALCVGCLLAIALDSECFRKKALEWVDWIYLPALATLLACMYSFHWLPPLIESVAIAILLGGAVLKPERFYSKAFSVKPLAWLGMISYSLYVWQEFFILPSGATANAFLNLSLIIFATASYYLIERPSIQFGRYVAQCPIKASIAKLREL